MLRHYSSNEFQKGLEARVITDVVKVAVIFVIKLVSPTEFDGFFEKVQRPFGFTQLGVDASSVVHHPGRPGIYFVSPASPCHSLPCTCAQNQCARIVGVQLDRTFCSLNCFSRHLARTLNVPKGLVHVAGNCHGLVILGAHVGCAEKQFCRPLVLPHAAHHLCIEVQGLEQARIDGDGFFKFGLGFIELLSSRMPEPVSR